MKKSNVIKLIISLVLFLVLLFFYYLYPNVFNTSNAATFFTAIAALSTAYAASMAAKSASISEQSLENWKLQMSTSLELQEAKDVKVALEAWYFQLLRVLNSKSCMSLLEIRNNMICDINVSNYYLESIQRHVNELEILWRDFEKTLNSTSIINLHDYQHNGLRNIHLKHIESCNKVLSRYVNIDHSVISGLYDFNDWDNYSNHPNMVKFKMESYDSEGNVNTIESDGGVIIYNSMIDTVQGFRLNVGIQVDLKIKEKRNLLT